MLLHHHCVDDLWVSEGQKAEAAGATSGAVSHDRAFDYLAVLREVLLHVLCEVLLVQVLVAMGLSFVGLTVSRLPVEATDEHLSTIDVSIITNLNGSNIKQS